MWHYLENRISQHPICPVASAVSSHSVLIGSSRRAPQWDMGQSPEGPVSPSRLRRLNVSIECKRVSGLAPATVDWAFDLTKTNMQAMYEQSEWGWKDREKREEMTDDRAWYLIAWENSSVPVAFSHFRFDVECGDEVLYCYEVQLESKVRRKGLGKFLIQILQLMANSTQMKKVMLTVFKHNHGAYQFFRDALQFEIDDSSPSMSGCCGEDCSYEILSRRTKFGDSQHSHAGGHCGGCCH
uniref:N-alpha-acetyltransferase 40 n=1 Tax=Sus scrofa TaxID=9823 RepID=A0A8D1EVR8_PIG